MFIEALGLEVTPFAAGIGAGLAVVAFVVYYVISAGLFFKPVVRTGSPPFETVCIAYKFYQGTYSVDAKGAFCDLYKTGCKSAFNSLGIYFDNPRLVENGKQRFLTGAILNKDLDVDEKLEKQFIEKGYKIAWITEIDYAVITEFPYNNMLSVLLAIKKVYPLLDTFIKKKRLCAHPCIEYYTNNKIQFVLPLSKQEKFYVQEYYEYENADSYYKEQKMLNKQFQQQQQQQQTDSFKDHKLVTKNSSSSDKKRH